MSGRLKLSVGDNVIVRSPGFPDVYWTYQIVAIMRDTDGQKLVAVKHRDKIEESQIVVFGENLRSLECDPDLCVVPFYIEGRSRSKKNMMVLE